MATNKTLYEKILVLCPNLTADDFSPVLGTIKLQNDGNGDYIKSWANKAYTEPTASQLATVV